MHFCLTGGVNGYLGVCVSLCGCVTAAESDCVSEFGELMPSLCEGHANLMAVADGY